LELTEIGPWGTQMKVVFAGGARRKVRRRRV
jgi:hypothetical protein